MKKTTLIVGLVAILCACAVMIGTPAPAPVAEAGLEPGLSFKAYQGTWTQLPDFAMIQPVASGTADRPSAATYASHPDRFALEFVGLVKVPADGLYTFFTRSDDEQR